MRNMKRKGCVCLALSLLPGSAGNGRNRWVKRGFLLAMSVGCKPEKRKKERGRLRLTARPETFPEVCDPSLGREAAGAAGCRRCKAGRKAVEKEWGWGRERDAESC